MAKTSYDLVVAGAGPAGTLAAYTAAAAGLQVLLLEQAAFPRPKACGGLLSGKALASLPWPLPEGVLERPIHGVRLLNREGECLRRRQRESFAVTTRRELLDWFLLEQARAAGARFLDKTSLVALEDQGNTITVTTPRGDYLSRVLIGADGYRSRVATGAGLRRRWRNWETGTAITLQPRLSPEQVDDFTGGDMVTFFTLPLPASLGWLFPLHRGINLGIGVPSLLQKRLFPIFKGFLGFLNQRYGCDFSCHPPRVWYLPAGAFRRPIARGNILLAGDAAGFVDPFSGEGIYWALNSGIMAGRLAAAHLAGTLEEPLSAAYSRECGQEWQQEFRLSLLLSLLTGTKGLFFRFLKHNPTAMELFPTVMEEPNCYRNLLRAALPRLPRLLARTLFP